jgi:hypothetical protein
MNSNNPTPPKYDLQELKRQVGIRPFEQRLHFDDGGFSKCPFHNGDGDTTFHLKMTEDGAVIGTCFSECNKTFDAIDFVKKFDDVQTAEAIRKLAAMVGMHGEAPSTILHKPKPAVPMTAAVWEKINRPVTDADASTLAASRPNSVTPSAAMLNAMGFKSGEMHGKTYITAPYRLGDTFYTIKARNIVSKDFINENSVSQKGLFNIDAVTEGCDVYVVESELDAAVLHESGYIAVSVINAKQQQLEPEVLKKLLTASRIFLVGDQDAAGQICMDNIARLLPADKQYRMKLPNKDVGELAKAAQQNDVDAFLLGDFKERWNAARKDSLASWVVLNIPFISDLSSEPQEWIVDRFLPMHGYLLISAKYGAQKSMVALLTAWGIEAGTAVLGRKVTRPVPVLYLDRENPQGTIGDRCKHLGVPANQIRYWGDWQPDEPVPQEIDDPRLIEFMVREHGVIIFDSLTDWLQGKDENNCSEMTVFALKFRRLARLGSGVIVLHHENKAGTVRGSTSIPAGSDMAMKMSKNDVTNIVTIQSERFRMCADWELQFKIDFHGARWLVEIIKDQSKTDTYKKQSASDIAKASAILADYHSKNNGAAMTQTQFLKMLHIVGISKDKGNALLTAGKNHEPTPLWTATPSGGKGNAILFRLFDWTEDEEM